MNSNKSKWLCLVILLTLFRASSQGTFQNLSFESAVFVQASSISNPYGVEWTAAMPGWVGYIGTTVQSVISSNALSLSTPNIAILVATDPADIHHGQYYIQLQNAFPVPTEVPALAQTGMLPVEVQSIRFLSAAPFAIGLTVTFAGTPIPLSLLGNTANQKQIWGGDISAFAGQTGELRFRGSGTLDYIQFSSQPIPEPGVLGLLGLSIGLFCCRSRWGGRT